MFKEARILHEYYDNLDNIANKVASPSPLHIQTRFSPYLAVFFLLHDAVRIRTVYQRQMSTESEAVVV
jgi:hypothetical protein